MKKILSIILLLIVLLSLTSCNGVIKSGEKTSTTSSSKKELITENDAIEIIKRKIGDDNGKRIIDIDGSTTVDNIDYFVIHAYYESSKTLDSQGTLMTFTYGWYYVNKSTGQAYLDDMTGQDFKLNPLNWHKHVSKSRDSTCL